jgi:hypothetical protein
MAAVASTGAEAPGTPAAPVDRTRQLDADDVEAEVEELEMEKEAEIDLLEGPTTTTIT